MRHRTKIFLQKHIRNMEGKKVFLTGGTGEIGRWIVEELLYSKATVIVGVRNWAKAEALRASLNDKYPKDSLCFLELNLNSLSSVDACILSLREAKPDYCIINSGYDSDQSQYNIYGIEERLMVNCYAPYRLIRELGRDIRCVAVVSISYTAVAKHKKNADLYASGKALLMQLTYILRTSKNYSIVLAHPGIAFTDLFRNRHKNMKLAFPFFRLFLKSNEEAALNIVYALICCPLADEWVGPKGLFEIFGRPGIKKIGKNFYSEANLREAKRKIEEIERKMEELK